MRKYLKFKTLLEKELYRSPTLEEIADKMNLSLQDIKELESLNYELISLNNLVGKENDIELQDFISNDDKNVEDIIIETKLQEDVRNLFISCNLTEQEINILMLRFVFF